jgi:cytosine/adenosine deaminase-related metal-dependent hydrolase
VLRDKTILVHCIHINKREMNYMAKTGTNAIHNPQSNMNNAVGVADIIEMLNRDVLVGLGTDGMTSRMQAGARIAYLLQRIEKKSPLVGFMEAPQLLLENNAKIANKFFYGTKVGELKKGNAADIILVDYIPFTPFNSNTFLGHFLFGIFEAQVDTTICNGKILMQNKKVKTLNEEKIASDAMKLAKRLWNRF